MNSKKIIIAITLLSIAAALFSACVFNSGSDVPELLDGDGMERSAYAVSEPVYPDMAPYPVESDTVDEKAYEAWMEDISAQQRELNFAPELNDFYSKIIGSFLSSAQSENKVISPLNLYMALSMLSEITDGETRAEIMELINCEDINTLRNRASDLWNANYRRDGATALTLANSLWLRNDSEYKEESLKALAEYYYASAFEGNMGSDEYNTLFRNWLNEETDGLLNNSVQAEELNEETALALASCIYYRAKWINSFNADKTAPAVFHAPDGDTEREFMHKSMQGNYYYADNFSAVNMYFENDGGRMEFILPDEGSDINALLQDGEFYSYINSGDDWDNKKFLIINLSVPKFDVEGDAELKEGLQSLGVKSVFENTADFSPITDDTGIYLSRLSHAARVAVDEEGVKAAAYTVMAMAGSGRPPEDEIDFTLDRPFIFLIKSPNNQPLFAGTVYNP